MKKNSLIKYLFFLSIFILSTSCCGFLKFDCDDDDPIVDLRDDTVNSDAALFASYTNSADNPKIELDESKTVGPIQINDNPILSTISSRYNLTFTGVTFKEAGQVFEVKSVETQTLSEEGWTPDSENSLKAETSKSLSVVLVLDVSSSLGNNISTIKARANSLVTNILNKSPDAKVAVVKFSRGNTKLSLTSNISSITSFITNDTQFTDNILGGGTYVLEGKSETALYEAMIEGISILKDTNESGKAIITFTDGKNNFQFDPANELKESVLSKFDNTNIQSYTVGFIGNANEIVESVLNDLSVNGDFSTASNSNELQTVFTRFSNNVSAIYDLTYNTNNGRLSNKRTIRFLFDLEQTN